MLVDPPTTARRVFPPAIASPLRGDLRQRRQGRAIELEITTSNRSARRGDGVHPARDATLSDKRRTARSASAGQRHGILPDRRRPRTFISWPLTRDAPPTRGVTRHVRFPSASVEAGGAAARRLPRRAIEQFCVRPLLRQSLVSRPALYAPAHPQLRTRAARCRRVRGNDAQAGPASPRIGRLELVVRRMTACARAGAFSHALRVVAATQVLANHRLRLLQRHRAVADHGGGAFCRRARLLQVRRSTRRAPAAARGSRDRRCRRARSAPRKVEHCSPRAPIEPHAVALERLALGRLLHRRFSAVR